MVHTIVDGTFRQTNLTNESSGQSRVEGGTRQMCRFCRTDPLHVSLFLDSNLVLDDNSAIWRFWSRASCRDRLSVWF
jgi:hypothetical protein